MVASCAAFTERAPTTLSPSAAATFADPCQSESVLRAEIEAFLADYNAGRAGLADRFFATGADFQWYSETPVRLGAPAYDRPTLEQYLLQRHAEGDHLTLVSLQVNSKRGDIGNFGFVLRRGDQDLQSKGAIDCVTAKFIVWSIGPAPGPA